MDDFLNHIGGFIDDPGRGTVVVFCWVFAPLITLAIVQRVRRIAKNSGTVISLACLDGISFYIAWAVAMLIQVGLYNLHLRPSIIHSLLIAGVHASAVNWWMDWAKEHNAGMYAAFSANRRSSDLDTTEIKSP